MKKPILALTMGDPGGVGPEVIIKALLSKNILKTCIPVIVGSKVVFEKLPGALFSKIESLPFTGFPGNKKNNDGKIYFWDVTDSARKLYLAQNKNTRKAFTFSKAKVSLANACFAWSAMDAAVKAVLSGEVSAVVTAPVNKTAMRLLDKNFKGHTEYLAQKSGVKKFAMMFAGKHFCVTLATVHLALKDVSRNLNKGEIADKILMTHEFIKRRMKIKKPRIAVSALNPHGEETGSEEREVILPAVRMASQKGLNVTGPVPADLLFYQAYQGHYDGVVSMYHDQALGPFKMISFHDGVNVTLGLPFLRTSPDHGTAFDIAYKNKAESESMESAIRFAARHAN